MTDGEKLVHFNEDLNATLHREVIMDNCKTYEAFVLLVLFLDTGGHQVREENLTKKELRKKFGIKVTPDIQDGMRKLEFCFYEREQAGHVAQSCP